MPRLQSLGCAGAIATPRTSARVRARRVRARGLRAEPRHASDATAGSARSASEAFATRAPRRRCSRAADARNRGAHQNPCSIQATARPSRARVAAATSPRARRAPARARRRPTSRRWSTARPSPFPAVTRVRTPATLADLGPARVAPPSRRRVSIAPRCRRRELSAHATRRRRRARPGSSARPSTAPAARLRRQRRRDARRRRGACGPTPSAAGPASAARIARPRAATHRAASAPAWLHGPDELCLDDGGLACRKLCTQDSDCVDPFGFVCVNPGFGFGVCIGQVPCQ